MRHSGDSPGTRLRPCGFGAGGARGAGHLDAVVLPPSSAAAAPRDRLIASLKVLGRVHRAARTRPTFQLLDLLVLGRERLLLLAIFTLDRRSPRPNRRSGADSVADVRVDPFTKTAQGREWIRRKTRVGRARGRRLSLYFAKMRSSVPLVVYERPGPSSLAGSLLLCEASENPPAGMQGPAGWPPLQMLG